MKKSIVFILSFFALSLLAAGKPVAVFGHPSDVSRISKDVLKPVGIKAETPKAWLKANELDKYSVIYFGERRGVAAEYTPALAEFVKNGGILIFSGSSPIGFTGQKRVLSKALDFLGYGYHGNLQGVKVDKIAFKDTPVAKELGFAGKSFTWKDGLNSYPTKVKSLEVVAEIVSGSKRFPIVAFKRCGKGEIWLVAPMYFRFTDAQKNTGYADEEGRFILTESGKNVEALKSLYIAIFRRSKNLAVEEVKKSSWGTVPLGKKGTIKYTGKFKNKPTYLKPVQLKNKFKLSENGNSLAQIVITDRAFRYQAAELKYHLDAITGANFSVVYPNKRNAKLAAIIFEKGKDAKTVSIKTTENTVTLSGDTSLAMFYFLEKLGCRYLWPGKLGKIIPKNPTLWAPDIQLKNKPMLALRNIRHGGKLGERAILGMNRCGITDVKAAAARRSAAYSDAKGNSSFYTWHGNGGKLAYSWGHAFGSYYKTYGKKNPEFFALQPDGSRSQAASPDRPRLCMSNPKLVKLVAENLIKAFKKNPSRQALSVCLNDGGRARFCMCEGCRKLDPPNAVPNNMSFNVRGIPISVKYVYLTDRVVSFSNRIAAEVNKVLPDKKVCVYIYSCYEAPPVAVKPSPSLVMFSTTMNYTRDSSRKKSLQTLASLSSFGNEVFWRPNALRGFGNIPAPQNYARRMFDDTELLKFNNCPGMDFDCNEGFWGGKGLIYYTLSKAMWNPDRLSFDDIVDDYCRAGFGEAAPQVRKYFDELEKVFDQAAAKECDYCDIFTIAKIDELKAILDEAENASSDAMVKQRVQFLKKGLELGRFSTRLYDAKKANAKNYRAIQKEWKEYIQKLSLEDPLVVSPGSLGFKGRFLVR